MKKIRCNTFTIAATTALVLLCGCKKTFDFLNIPDSQYIDAKIWEVEGSVQYLLNEAYYVSLPEFPYNNSANDLYTVSDETVHSITSEWPQRFWGIHGSKAAVISEDFKFIGSKYQGDNIGDNRYYDIARCNLALKWLPTSKGISPLKIKWFMGQFQALRAMIYFQLFKYYGGVPLITDAFTPEDIQNVGRAKAKDIIKLIVADCDDAMVKLEDVEFPVSVNGAWGKMTKPAAAALKAKALWLWASPLFNPKNDAAHPYDAGRWVEANKAAREAYEICTGAGYELIPDYGNIFQMEGPLGGSGPSVNKEAIIVRSYNAVKNKRGNDVEQRSRPASEGGETHDGFRPATALLEAYCMKDGVPASAAAGTGSYTYDPNHIWINRDPRFDASIGYNGSVWMLSGKAGRRQWTYDGNGDDGKVPFYCKRFTSPNLPATSVRRQSDLGGSGMDWIELRLAEVILIYAECANETGDITTAKDMVRMIRKRAKVEEGYRDYGLALATNPDEMRELIYNERMIEFAMEGKRNDDLRRTRRLHLLNGKNLYYPKSLKTTSRKWWLGGTSPSDSANVVKFLATKLASDPTKTNRDTINMNNPSSVDIFFLPFDGSGVTPLPVNVDPARYFLPFNNFYLGSSSLFEQTLGWPAGSFDPL